MGVASKKRMADIRLTCPMCPKTVVDLNLVTSSPAAALYEGMCNECMREFELTVTDMPKEL